MTATATEAQTLSLNTPGDTLAMVGSALGYRPSESLVLIGLFQTPDKEMSTGGFLRLDIPEEDFHPSSADYAVSLIAEDHTAAVLVLYSENARNLEDTQKAVGTALEAADIPLMTTWHVTGETIREAHGGTAEKISDLDLSEAAAAHWTDEVRTPADDVAAYRTARATDSELSALAQVQLATRLTADPVASLADWDKVLTGETHTGKIAGDYELIASLNVALDSPNVLSGLIMLTGTDFSTAAAVAAGEESDETVAIAEGTMLGTSATPPDWDKIDSLADALLVLAAYTTDETESQLLTLMGWIEFARGRNSRASAFLDAATALDEGNALATLMNYYIGAGTHPQWARRRDTAWNRR